mgnify:CR=1 FL=1
MREVGRVSLIQESWALSRELVQQTRWGGFASTTLWGCPTRKYHSWLSVWRGFGRYELLPQVEELLHLEQGHFLLTTHFFQGRLAWEGYRHLTRFTAHPAWSWHYQVGELRVVKTFFLHPTRPVACFEYTFSGPVLFRWTPLWAVRAWHTLRHEPLAIVRKGDQLNLGEDLVLYLKVDPVPRFIPWSYPYAGSYYPREAERGYEATETLYAAECWEWRLHGPGTIRIALSLTGPVDAWPSLPAEAPGFSFTQALAQAAEQFFLSDAEGEYILAGHPWFGVWGRDTFISLPGLTLVRGQEERFHRIMETALRYLSPDGRFPTIFPEVYTAEDVGLWWGWAILQYLRMGADPAQVYRRYGEVLHQVVVGYLQGLAGEDGLLRVPAFPPASWMDAVIEGQPAVPRQGALVELNALWYALLRLLAELSPSEGARWRWDLLARRVLAHFKPTFWEKSRGYLADWREGPLANWQIRPNQLFAAALPYRPISDKIAELVLETVEKHLLTPRGLRTLSPGDPAYCGLYEGSPAQRDYAYHNGTVWPWLLGSYADAKLALWGEAAKPALEALFSGFESVFYAYGWEQVAEIFDGDAPHTPRGAPAQAWSVAELLRIAFHLRRL